MDFLSPQYREDVNKCCLSAQQFHSSSLLSQLIVHQMVRLHRRLVRLCERVAFVRASLLSAQRERIIDNWARRCMKMLQRVNRLFTTAHLLCECAERSEEGLPLPPLQPMQPLLHDHSLVTRSLQ